MKRHLASALLAAGLSVLVACSGKLAVGERCAQSDECGQAFCIDAKCSLESPRVALCKKASACAEDSKPDCATQLQGEPCEREYNALAACILANSICVDKIVVVNPEGACQADDAKVEACIHGGKRPPG